jgi:hypothetical protein
MTIVRYHLATMARIDVRYDLLPARKRHPALKFWDAPFSS